jgi:hypothetical protein
MRSHAASALVPWGDVDRFDNNRNVEVVGSSPITSTNVMSRDIGD